MVFLQFFIFGVFGPSKHRHSQSGRTLFTFEWKRDKSRKCQFVMAMKVQLETFDQGWLETIELCATCEPPRSTIVQIAQSFHWQYLRSNFTWARKVLFRWVSNRTSARGCIVRFAAAWFVDKKFLVSAQVTALQTLNNFAKPEITTRQFVLSCSSSTSHLQGSQRCLGWCLGLTHKCILPTYFYTNSISCVSIMNYFDTLWCTKLKA